MATLAPQGPIDEETVRDEIARLKQLWASSTSANDMDDALANLLGSERLKALDPFDRAQLATVVSVCRRTNSLSSAGREHFAVSRLEKSSSNDADRLRKHLARFDLVFDAVAGS